MESIMISQNNTLKAKKVLLLLFLIEIIILFNSNINPRTLYQIEDDQNSQYRFFENLKTAANSGKIAISNWTEAVDSGICSGSGTFSDPYIIQDCIIDGNGTGTGISIGNSKNVYFRIENCTIFNCTYGIRLGTSCNGTLLNNDCSYNEVGIYLDGGIDIPNPTPEMLAQCYSMNNTVSNNTINNNEDYGIYCRGVAGGPPGELENNIFKGNFINNNRFGIYFQNFCINNTVLDNVLINNEDIGIFLDGPCYNNTIKGNKMEKCGFYSHYYYFSLNTIDTTNLVNGGHLYFYANSTGLDNDDFSNAGQIYLINCNSSVITGQDLSDGALSISLIGCKNLEISYNNLSSNSFFGMDLLNCSEILINRNEINSNTEGIEARNVNNSIISENEISFNLREGIYTSSFNNNSILRNNINSNGFRAGLRMFGYCSDNLISDNKIINNFYEGFSLALSSSNNLITGNIFKSNLIGVDFDPSCVNNNFYLNFFIDNEDSHATDIPITNTWNTTDIGNYWDNYTGTDNNDDGIGEIPHLIDYSSLIYDYLPIVDNLAPNITINSPTSNQEFESSPSFNIRIEEKYLDAMWYTLDDGSHNYSFTQNGTINQIAWDSLSDGLITLRFYAIDKVGNLSFKDVIINKASASESIPGYNLLIITGIFLSFCSLVIIVVRRKRLKN